MNRMVQAIRGSSVPVVVYVAPRGAIAGSAGTILVLAGHAAAMAPETAIGAASPVGAQGEDLDQTLASKMREIMKATARTLAGWRGLAALELAQATIDEAAAASTGSARRRHGRRHCRRPDDLLTVGWPVRPVVGQPLSHRRRIPPVPPTLIERFFCSLTNPTWSFCPLGCKRSGSSLHPADGDGFVGVALALGAYGLNPLYQLVRLIFLADSRPVRPRPKALTHGARGAGLGASSGDHPVQLPETPSFQRASVPWSSVRAPDCRDVRIPSPVVRAQRRPIVVGAPALIGHVGPSEAWRCPGRSGLRELWAAETEPHEAAIEEGSGSR
jgi:membrane-bound serine protease (ClpP class)